MTYSLLIKKRFGTPVCDYVSDILTWPDVTNYLRSKLDDKVTKVEIFKYSSNHKCLGHKVVTIDNIVKVATSLRDTILLSHH